MAYNIDLATKRFLYSLDSDHFEIACDGYTASVDYQKKLNGLSRIEKEHTFLQGEYEGKATREAIKSIVFSAFTAEAFINDYLIDKSSQSYFDSHLDKLTIISKWVIGPKIFNASGIDTQKETYPKLKQLIKWRNDLAHFKRFAVDPDKVMKGEEKKFEEIYCAKNAKIGIECVYSLVAELMTYDANIKVNPFEELYKKTIS